MNKIIIYLEPELGIGDYICFQPIIKHLKNCLCANVELIVATKYPEIFEGSGITTIDSINNYKLPHLKKGFSFFQLATPFKKVNNIIPEDILNIKLIDSYINPLSIHCIDYLSLVVLGKTLPDEDKKIVLKAKEEYIEQIKNRLYPIDPEKIILVHRKSISPHRQILPDYSYQLLYEVSKIGPTVLIGKGSEEEPVSDVLDLTNKLSLNELIAIISMAKVLITTDSVPLHIASAFDNNIILLTTLRHPDNILHIRNGSKYHKAIALYKKVEFDTTVPHFYNITKSTFDDLTDIPNFNIIDYLPNIEDIVANCVKMYNS